MNTIIKWADSPNDKKGLLDKPSTPFEKGQMARPIRITFHSSTLKELSEGEKTALDVLLEFAAVESPNLSVLITEPGNIQLLEIGSQSEDDSIPVTIRYSEEHYLQSGIRCSNQLPDLANYMVGRLVGDSSDQVQALQDLIVARAHHSVHHDILVTNSKWLLRNKEIGYVEEANPLLPSEALKIVGLLFRIRGDFRYAGRSAFDRGLFYWTLVRHKLPAMWRYFSACVYSEKPRGDDILVLGQSILVRCERAMQACDEIGRLFYVRQNNNTRDEAMYHFDYLTLLLSGALDAQARVAYRTYQITVPSSERNVNFRDGGFVTEISKTDSNLAGFLNGDYFKDISKIISKMRNTIHGAGLITTAYQDGVAPEKSFVHIPDIDAQTIWDICDKYGSAANWGLLKLLGMILFEPYAFSQRLLEHSSEIVNTIAILTQVEKLFPAGVPIPELKKSPPADDDTFDARIGERLALLA